MIFLFTLAVIKVEILDFSIAGRIFALFSHLFDGFTSTNLNLQKKQKMEPILYMTEWFLCVYTRTLPWESILRVWDMFLCEGVKIIFKVGLVLLKGCLGRTSVTKSCPTMYETLQILRNPSPEIMEEEALVYQVIKVFKIIFQHTIAKKQLIVGALRN